MPAPNSDDFSIDSYLFDSFEVSVRSGVLRKDGVRIQLQELPFQMLVVLLERHGELVTKEEMKQLLWTSETYIDVDKSLYVMAGKLRLALGDSSSQPRFIRTVSGRGYRFIGTIDPVFNPAPLAQLMAPTSASASSSGSSFLVQQPQVQPQAAGRLKTLRLLRIPKPKRFVPVLAGIAVVLAVLSALIFYRYLRRPLASDQDKIVVGGLSNQTGNPDLDRTLSSAARVKLQESPYLSFVPDASFRILIKNPDDASLKDQLKACTQLNAQILLNGQILQQGQGFRVVIRAWRCAGGSLLKLEKADAASQADILPALDLAVEKMRRTLGEPDTSLQKFNVPLVQATTSSLAALKAFTLGEEKRAEGQIPEAIASYRLATDLDPQFATAYARLGTLYHNSEQETPSRQAYQKAFELRNRSTDRERLYIVAHYHEYALGETMRAIEDYEVWQTLYPRDLVPANNLAIDLLEVGQPQRALEPAQQAVRLDPANSSSYNTLAEVYLRSGDYADLHALCLDPAHRQMKILGFHRVCYRLAFVEGNEAEMRHQMQWAHGNPEESEAIVDTAWVAMLRGKVIEARDLFAEATQVALRNGSPESAVDAQLDEALLEADLGYAGASNADVLEALKTPMEDPFQQAMAARVLATTGDVQYAETLAREAALKAPQNTILNTVVLASVRSTIQLRKGNPKAAIQSYEEARAFDFCPEMELAPAYYRGLAYLQDKQLQEAIKEFQKVIDRRNQADFPIYVALAQLQLGRAYQLSGQTALATQALTEVGKVWKDADPDFPPLLKLLSYRRELTQPAHTARAGL